MRLLPVPFAALFMAVSLTAGADTLDMPPQESSMASEKPVVNMVMPTKKMTMSQVMAEFGEPNQKFEPVGDPPISRWVYDDYTVYFEYKHVVHAVLNRK